MHYNANQLRLLHLMGANLK